MCDFITPTMLAVTAIAISTASAGMTFIQQGQQAKAQRKSVEANYAQQMQSLQLQYDQTNKQSTDEMSVRAREAMIENAKLRAISGESGLAGISNDRMENESQFNLGTDIASIESNRQSTLKQIHQEGKAVRAGNQSQINQIQRPSLLGTGLQIAQGAVNAAGNYKAAKNKLPAYVTG